MRISDWSSDVCSSDLLRCANDDRLVQVRQGSGAGNDQADHMAWPRQPRSHLLVYRGRSGTAGSGVSSDHRRSEEHTSELQSLMRISYAVVCLKKKNINHQTTQDREHRTANTTIHRTKN